MATYKCKKPYMYGTGRRKSSIARVHLIPNGSGVITINGRDIDDYFGLETLKLIVRQPLVTTGTVGKVDIEASVAGGGVSGQAGAIRHGIARALLVVDENNRAALKAAGLLTRDPRMKERKKYGSGFFPFTRFDAICPFLSRFIRVKNGLIRKNGLI